MFAHPNLVAHASPTFAVSLPPTLPAARTIDPPSDRDRRFGETLSASGLFLATTAPTDGDNALEAGNARVYQLHPRGDLVEVPQEIGVFRARSAGDHFGAAVALAHHATEAEPRLRLAIGVDRANFDQPRPPSSLRNICEFAGAVEVHFAPLPLENSARSASGWFHEATLVSPEPQSAAEFGAAVALSDDWSSRFPQDLEDASAFDSAVPTTNPTLASGPFRSERSTYRATSVASPALVVGSPRYDINMPQDSAANLQPEPQFDAGCVDLFEYAPTVTALGDPSWQHRVTLLAPNPMMSAWFGRAVAIGHLWIAVGAPGERDDRGTSTTADDIAGAGAVHLYLRTHAEGKAHANYVATLRAPSPSQSAWFGWSLALDDASLVVGCPRASRHGNAVGCVYRFDLNDFTVGPERIDAPEPQEGAAFGLSLDMYGDALLVGAPGMDVSHAMQSMRASPSGFPAIVEDVGACWLFHDGQCARLIPSTQRQSILFGNSCALLPVRNEEGDTGARVFAACGHQYVEEESIAPSPGVGIFAPPRSSPP